MTVSSTTDLVDGYGSDVAGLSRPDELLDADGAVRPHWARLLGGYRRLGPAELARRRDEIELLLEREGVSYNPASSDADRGPASSRAWTLDPIPLVLPEADWQHLERGIQQRAELLDALLADLYGARRLLRERLIPPAMVLGDPQYLRAWQGVTSPGHRQLPVAAVDLYRDPAGSWKVLSHRAQAPSGMAYALENRRALARVFPALFRSAQVRRLAPFFDTIRAAVEASAPAEVERPTVVVLSPGALSETAFEHAALATRLGYPLVEGGDLRIRSGQVWLQTISDLVPVHVILRRVDALYCDPLELRPDSALGVPGLVDACRTGAVTVLNPLGAGALENAGLLALLPRLARALLGTDLVLDGVESWWCGDPVGRSHVLANLGGLVVRPLSRASLTHSVDTTRLGRTELDQLRTRIESQPENWVGQERIEPASSPVYRNGRLRPCPTVLRTFTVAAEHGYVVLPGGLARTTIEEPTAPITNRSGAIAKDTWVIGPDPAQGHGDAPSRITGSAAVAGPTAARAAENLFWLGRYAERAEASVRLLRAVSQRRADVGASVVGPGPTTLRALLEATTRLTGTWPGFVGDDADAALVAPERELTSLVADRHRPGTVAQAIDGMFAAMGVVRDQLSVDNWLVVGSLQRRIDDFSRDGFHQLGSGPAPAQVPAERDAIDAETIDSPIVEDDADELIRALLDDLLHGLLSLSGLATESMVRDQGWHMMDAGRRIERALHVAGVVGEILGPGHDRATEALLLDSVAETTESIVTYRRRDQGQARVAALIELLILDANNPRSVRFQIDRLSDDLAVLRASAPTTSTPTASPLVLEAVRLVQDIEPARLDLVTAGRRVELIEATSTIRGLLTSAADGIAADYFTRLLPQRAVRTPIESPRRPT